MNRMGAIIREERLHKGLSQEELAEKVGVTQDSISLWEQGKRLPNTQYVILLCRILEITPNYFFGFEK